MGVGGYPAVVVQLVAEHWQLKPEVFWVPPTAGLFTFLSLPNYFQHEAICSEQV